MGLPFLKHKQEGSQSTPVESLDRKPDEAKEPEMDFIAVLAEEMIEAIDKKDAAYLKDCLEAFAEHLRHMDEAQDAMPEE